MAAKKRWLTDAACKITARKIQAEMPEYAEALAKYVTVNQTTGIYAGSFIPIWGPDLEAVKVKVAALYHADEAKVIIAALTA